MRCGYFHVKMVGADLEPHPPGGGENMNGEAWDFLSRRPLKNPGNYFSLEANGASNEGYFYIIMEKFDLSYWTFWKVFALRKGTIIITVLNLLTRQSSSWCAKKVRKRSHPLYPRGCGRRYKCNGHSYFWSSCTLRQWLAYVSLLMRRK